MPVDVLVPPVGTNVDTLTLATWYKREGEAVEKGEPLFAVETDKATLDVEAPASGILRQVACSEGAEIAALSRIAVIAAPGETLSPTPTSPETAGRVTSTADQTGRGPTECPSSAGMVMHGQTADAPPDRPFISPRAKRLAVERGLEWRALRGTGPEGAIVERDVRAALEAAAGPRSITPLAQRVAAEAGLDWRPLTGTGAQGKVVREDVVNALRAHPPSIEDGEEVETIPVTGVREVIFERMARSAAETAPVTLTTETDATALVELRAHLKADGVAVSYNDLLLAILARALREHPRLNASLEGGAIRLWNRIHIGLAVDTERGLLVPVIRDVDRKGLAEIAGETAARIEAARQGSLLPEDLRGGTFTLTNLGMFGIDAFTPIINLPECAILGAGRIKPQPSVVEDRIVVRQKIWLSLTFDHRLVDGGPAARFLQRVAQLVEKPHLLLS